MIFNLPQSLQEEILSKVPLKSLKQLRSTCKGWYHHVLFKDPIFIKKLLDKTSRQYYALVVDYYSVSSLTYGPNEIKNSIGLYMSLNNICFPCTSLTYISQAFHCDGVLLCTTDKNFIAWNPFSGKTLWIQPRKHLVGYQLYALGYDNKNLFHSYKILRFVHYKGILEMYDFRTDLWRNLDDVSPDVYLESDGVSLNGDTYWISKRRNVKVNEYFLLKFDFSIERFENMNLPFCEAELLDVKSLSVVREENLSLFYQNAETRKIEVWVSNEIGTRFVSWSKFFTVDYCLRLFSNPMSFFIDEKKEVVICVYKYKNINTIDMVLYNNQHDDDDDDQVFEHWGMLESMGETEYWPSVFGYVPKISFSPV